MKRPIALAILFAICFSTNLVRSQTFQPTTGNVVWNDNSNWGNPSPPVPFPNAAGAITAIQAPTGALTIDLGQSITVGSIDINKSSGNFTTTIGVGATNTLTFDGGTSTLQSGDSATAVGQTTVAAPIVFGAAMPSSTFTINQTGTSTLQLTGGMSGTGNLKVTRDTNGSAAVALGAANTYNGTTTFLNSQTNQNFLLVRLDDVNSIPGGISNTGGTSALTVSGSVVIGLGANDFKRTIAPSTGPAADQIQFTNQGNSGWAAFGQDRAVNLFGDARRVAWGTATGTNPPIGLNLGTLVLGHNLADKTLDFQNILDLNTGTGSVNRTIRIVNGSAAVDAKFSAPIQVGQGTGNLTFTGATAGDGTVSLMAANTWNGTTTFNSGVTVRLENAAALPNGNLTLSSNGIVGLGVGNDSFTRALGTAAGQIQITNGGGFAAFGGNKTVNLGGAGATVTWGTGNFVQSGSSLTLGDANSDATVDFQNGIDLSPAANDRTILAPDGSAAVDGKVSGVITGAGTLRKNNPGTLEISNANTYTGTTLINAGTLLLTNATSIPGGITGGNTNAILFTGTAENPVPTLGLGQGDFTSELSTTVAAGHVNLSSGSGTNAGFAAYGADRVVNFKSGGVTQSAVWGAGGFVTGVLGLSAPGSTGTVDLQNPIDLGGGARKVKVANGTASTDGKLSGVLSGTGGSLVKDGSGTLALAGNNTYDGGTSIIQGRLNVNNTTGSGTGSGSVTVTAGTLGGTGSISGAVTVAAGATIAPGTSIESLDSGALTISGGTLAVELDSSVSTSVGADRLNVSGNLSIASGSKLTLTDLAAVSTALGGGTKFTLIGYTGTWDNGIFNDSLNNPIADDTNVTVGANTFTINYNDAVDGANFVSGSFTNYVTLSIPGLAGDHNGDNKVDAADYVLWRKDPAGHGGDPAGYDAWRGNFGTGTGSGGAQGNQSVPEPATLVLVLIAIPLVAGREVLRRFGQTQ
jgi:autotransporter-associated beta strand protein